MSESGFANLSNSEKTQIVIVGAGISGLYCAWRLLQDDSTRRITIIERLNRTGGRLDTDIIQVRPGQVVREEEGGMRFNYAMTELMSLNHTLGLCDQIVPFPMSSTIDGSNTNRFFLRGRRFTAQEAASGHDAIWGEIYSLADSERGKSPARIIQDVYDAILHANGEQPPKHQAPDFWTRFRNELKWNGTPLRDWQLWGLLRDMGYSEECVQMLSETIGFAGPFLAPINAGDALQILADFPVDPQYFTFERGFSTLPNAVRDQLAGKVQILLSTNVDRITRTDAGFALTLTEAPGQQDSNPYIPGGLTKEITCDNLVLAVAASGLERLFVTSPALNEDPDAERLWASIHATRGMRLLKINLYFTAPWWLDGGIDPPVQFGPNFSNLPVNAVYPFYSLATDQEAAGSVPLTEQEAKHYGAAALTIYCDLNNTAFWEGLQNVGPKFTSDLQERHSSAPQVIFPASDQVVWEAKRQLAMLFGIDEVPDPLLTSYRLWDGNDDFEYAYHQWRLGVDDEEVRGYLSAPIPGVHIANEAVSDMQGWVNGSLRSSDRALRHFGIEPMDDLGCTQVKQPPNDAPKIRKTPGLWGG